MRRLMCGTIVVLGALLTGTLPGRAPAQAKKIVYWTHWEQNPEFNKWYETKGKEFARKSGYEVEVVTIPYQGSSSSCPPWPTSPPCTSSPSSNPSSAPSYRTLPGGASRFVGTRLYERVLTDPVFWNAVGNTVKLLAMSVPTTVGLALAVAIGLDRLALRWRSLWAAMYFIEYNLVTAAAVLSVLPILAIFVILQKWVVQAAVMTGLKG